MLLIDAHLSTRRAGLLYVNGNITNASVRGKRRLLAEQNDGRGQVCVEHTDVCVVHDGAGASWRHVEGLYHWDCVWQRDGELVHHQPFQSPVFAKRNMVSYFSIMSR